MDHHDHPQYCHSRSFQKLRILYRHNSNLTSCSALKEVSNPMMNAIYNMKYTMGSNKSTSGESSDYSSQRTVVYILEIPVKQPPCCELDEAGSRSRKSHLVRLGRSCLSQFVDRILDCADKYLVDISIGRLGVDKVARYQR